jgi:hypothetical protein
MADGLDEFVQTCGGEYVDSTGFWVGDGMVGCVDDPTGDFKKYFSVQCSDIVSILPRDYDPQELFLLGPKKYLLL